MIASLDRVRVTWEGSGTSSPISLGAAINPTFFAPTSALNGLTVSYLIEHKSEGIFEVELGRGVYTHSGTTLARTEIVASTNGGIGGSLVNFSPGGIKHVSLALLVSDLGDLSALNTPWRSLAPDDEDLTISDTSGADILVTYGGALTAGRTVSIDAAMLPASGRGRLVMVFNETSGGFEVTVDDENDDPIASLATGWGAVFKALSTGASLAERAPINAGSLAALDAIASQHVVAEVISGQVATTDASNSDLILLLDATDGLIKKQTRGNFLTGIVGGGGGTDLDFIADNTDYSGTPYEADSNLVNVWVRLTSAGTNQINFAAGITEDSFGAFDVGPSAGAEIIGDSGVTINGLDDRGGANPAISMLGYTTWVATADDVIELSTGGITEGSQKIYQPTEFLAPVTLGAGASISDAGPIAASGTLVKATHGGRAVRTTGNVTIPNSADDVGMGGIIIIGGGGHTVGFGAAVTAGLAVDDVVTYYVSSTTILLRSIQTWASRLTMS